MDKTEHPKILRSNQKGFALLITLSVLSAVIVLTTVLLSYFEEARNDAIDTKALIQADLYYADIVHLFKGIKDKKSLFSRLYKTPIPLNDPEGRFSLVLDCKPLVKGVDINWLGLEENGKMQPHYKAAQELFEHIAFTYNIQNPSRLREMILEEIGKDNRIVTGGQRRLSKKNGMISYKQFSAIALRYRLEEDDGSVEHIAWEKYFSFFPDAKVISEKYMSGELISLLFDMELLVAKEWESKRDSMSLESFVIERGGDFGRYSSLFAGDTFMNQSACTVQYAMDGKQYRFGFDWIEEEAKHFEFYGQY
ncbi:MAG: hypothetical protein ABXS92_07450 [Sulfurimonas sp.]